jgi:hypothetical protein
MKITKQQLRRIIKEERVKLLKEAQYSDEFSQSDQTGAEGDVRTEAYLDWMHEQLAPKANDILAMLLDRKHAPYNSEEMAEIINSGSWIDAVNLGESLLEAFKIDFEKQEKIYTGEIAPDEEW